MPQIIAWAAAAIASAIVPTGIAATATTVGGLTTLTAVTTGVAAQAAVAAVIETAAYAAIGALMQPKVAAAHGTPTEWTSDPRAPIPFVMGLRGTAGIIRHRDTFGPDNRYEGIVTVYSGGGPINGYGSFYVDGTARTFTGEVMNGTPINALYRQTKLGAQPDTALTSPSVSGGHVLSGWTTAHKLSGNACSMITLFQDGNFRRWPSGEPKVIQEVQGILAWDPRLDSTWPGGVGACRLATPSTWVYSTNPIIHALKWALGIRNNGLLVGGIGASVGAIDVTSFITAANVADTNSWTVSAIAYSLDDKYEVFRLLLQAGGAVPARSAGKISCISRAANPSSVITLTADDTAGPFELEAGAPRETRINTATPSAVSSAHAWEIVDLAPVTSSTYVTEDGGATRSRGVPLPFVSDTDQAAQLASYEIANSREWPVSTIPFKPYLRDVALGDAITIDEDEFGLVSQKFLVVGRSFDPKSDIVTLSIVTETAAKHAWALGKTGTAPSSPSLGGTDPTIVPTPLAADWTLAAGTSGVPSLVVTGAVPSTVTVAKIIVEYKLAADSIWVPAGEYGTETTRIEISGLTESASYDVRLSYRNVQGVPGATLARGPTTTTALAADSAATVPWTGVTGAAKPEDNATVGATAGTNLKDSGAVVLGDADIKNSAVSISAAGALSGAGGGTVTIGGLGYTGDLNATLGAAWGSNVTGRPTELTDGRVSAGLDASGDVARDVKTDKVVTDSVATGAVQRVSVDQTVGLGANCVVRSGTADPTRRALIKTYNFTVDTTGKLSIFFLSQIELKSGNRLYFYLKVTSVASPTWGTDNVMTNADLVWEMQGGSSDRQPSVAEKVFASGLTAGSHTVEVWWNDGGSGAHDHECNDPLFRIIEHKKAA